ncbi:MAG TPA: hypothetical protein VNO81_05680 [Candidatus Nitrosotenuis sp.]|jgi:predicted lipid-binding transport protein (Tim44 family)|nr:hypothetical protein [Candidatus Nitrosotenuis sp.]
MMISPLSTAPLASQAAAPAPSREPAIVDVAEVVGGGLGAAGLGLGKGALYGLASGGAIGGLGFLAGILLTPLIGISGASAVRTGAFLVGGACGAAVGLYQGSIQGWHRGRQAGHRLGRRLAGLPAEEPA